MPLEAEVVIDAEVAFSDATTLVDVLAHSFDVIGADGPSHARLTLRLTDDVRISDLHERFFGDPAPTDVISFPAEDDELDPGYLGDIVISVDTARSQARDASHSLTREIAFLALHGLLHLRGLRDDTEQARREMLARQTQMLDAYEADLGQPL